MIVCLCRGVSDRTVRLVVAQGATTTDAVAARCGAGGDCGSCRAMVEDIIEEAAVGAAAAATCCANDMSERVPAIAAAG